MAFVGIDPGAKGAFGVISTSGDYVLDYPGDVASAANMVGIQFVKGIEFCLIEEVHSMPGQGVSSTGKFMRNFGEWLGILAALDIPYMLIPPERWKRAVGVTSDKATSVKRASELFPSMAGQFVGPQGGLKADRAEAMLLAWFAKRVFPRLPANFVRGSRWAA